VPLPALAGAEDAIGPVPSVRPIVGLVTGVDDLRFEIVPGGHLGMLTGCAALDRRRARSARKPAAASKAAIGADPNRRYGSASSRTLARR
jgi:polyhydroxyalkanoate synthase subunit PhaC